MTSLDGVAVRDFGAVPGGVAVPAAASVAVRDTLFGPRRRGAVVGVFRTAVYVAVGRDVVALVTTDGLRLPNALVVSGRDALRGVAPGDAAAVGAGSVDVGTTEVRVGRWWDPRPRLGAVDPAVLVANATAAAALSATAPGNHALAPRAAAFANACRSGDAGGIVAAGGRLLGLGDGLTPAGDDLLAGTLAGWRLFGEAVGGDAGHRRRRLAGQLLGRLQVGGRTTALSAALLRHAAAGEVAVPVADACRALAGRTPLRPAVPALARVGHSSGGWLLRGLVVAAGVDAIPGSAAV